MAMRDYTHLKPTTKQHHHNNILWPHKQT